MRTSIILIIQIITAAITFSIPSHSNDVLYLLKPLLAVSKVKHELGYFLINQQKPIAIKTVCAEDQIKSTANIYSAHCAEGHQFI